ncbi:T9SS-dependent choice-of-anchor J family protein [Thermaurantimonas aggregans]|uniref:T9SS-dependent choice-of-anchor J family protein n=1 Tax=Thermaurantimonas aggregans TaxID=2173829 RepID=UPI0023F46250|nr:choice-of-anchor J domain-containing protein [Thermaurantimonas aggregans]MCX8148499.1 T9SS type A sorting domain-containing protein [Thermaurantimonas aggregans]
MKKNVLFLIFVTLLGTYKSTSQVIFSENFQNGMPSTFILRNLDGLTPASQVSFVNQAWVARQETGTTNFMAVSTSWYNPPGVSNDWMITPPITVNQANAWLTWRAMTPDASYRDGYEVRLSPNADTAISAFSVVLFSTNAEEVTWTNRAVSLANYNNQTIRIAFRNNSNDKFLLYIDDIAVAAYNQIDVAGKSLNMNSIIAPGNVTISGVLTNLGQTITSMTINYRVNNGSVVSQALSNLNIAPTQDYAFTFTQQWNATVGNHTIRVWATNINGQNDQNPANDTIVQQITVANETNRIPLLELFSSSTCPPCAPANANFKNFMSTQPAGEYSIIKYQMNWPGTGDPYYTAEGGVRRQLYGINAVPAMKIDGQWDGHQGQLNQTILSSFKNQPAFIKMRAGYSLQGQRIYGGVEIEPLFNLPAGQRLFIAVYETETQQNAKSNGETRFYDIFKKFVPDTINNQFANPANGIALPAINANQKYIVPYTYTFKGTFILPPNANVPVNHAVAHTVENFNNLRVVAWIQDMNNKTVWQSTIAQQNLFVGLSEQSENNVLSRLYPNPAKDVVRIEVTSISDSETYVEVISINGQKLFEKTFNSIENELIELNVSNLPEGLYLVRIKRDEQLQTHKLKIIR